LLYWIYLFFLRRIDFEAHCIKSKTMLDAISLCLDNKSDFSGDVIKEVLRNMLADAVPPYALMRTAIISAQSFGDVKRYVLSDVIPGLVRKAIWEKAPKLWEGVVFGTKNLAVSGFKNSELTLRALLGVPAPQLQGLLKAAPTVKVPMAKLLKTLSEEEKEEVTSGRWVGLVAGPTPAAAAAAAAAEGSADVLPPSTVPEKTEAELKLIADKKKLIKLISETPII
jgi:hypothetical protein